MVLAADECRLALLSELWRFERRCSCASDDRREILACAVRKRGGGETEGGFGLLCARLEVAAIVSPPIGCWRDMEPAPTRLRGSLSLLSLPCLLSDRC